MMPMDHHSRSRLRHLWPDAVHGGLEGWSDAFRRDDRRDATAEVTALVVLLIALLLGVGVTFAEPAIGALKAAGAIVTIEQAPYLYTLLNFWAEELVALVGLGVGLAAVLGTMRFLYSWSLKPLIFASLVHYHRADAVHRFASRTQRNTRTRMGLWCRNDGSGNGATGLVTPGSASPLPQASRTTHFPGLELSHWHRSFRLSRCWPCRYMWRKPYLWKPSRR